MTTERWAQVLRARFPPAPSEEVLPVGSRLLRIAEPDVRAAVCTRVGRREVQLQIHRVLAGRHAMENTIALAAVAIPEARGNVFLRLRDRYRFLATWRRSSWPMRCLILMALPLLLPLLLPGYVLVVTTFTILKRLSGLHGFARLASADLRRRFIVESRSEDDARAALSPELQRLVELAKETTVVQIHPGWVVLETRFEAPGSLDELLAPDGDLARVCAA